MFAGGAESSIWSDRNCRISVTDCSFSTSDDPYASIPFDKNRKGLGEGAGVVVLEELEHAKCAYIYAEVVGYGATARLLFHITTV